MPCQQFDLGKTNSILAIEVSPQGFIAIGSTNGLHILAKNKKGDYESLHLIKNHSASEIVISADGVIFYNPLTSKSENRAIHILMKDAKEPSTSHQMIKGYFNDLAVTSDNMLVARLDNGILIIYKKNSSGLYQFHQNIKDLLDKGFTSVKKSFRAPHELPTKYLACNLQDEIISLSDDSVLCVFRKGSDDNYSLQQKIPVHQALCFVIDKSNNIIIGHADGTISILAKINNQTYQLTQNFHAYPAPINRLSVNAQGTIACWYDYGKTLFADIEEKQSSNHVNIWVRTSDGKYSYQGELNTSMDIKDFRDKEIKSTGDQSLEYRFQAYCKSKNRLIMAVAFTPGGNVITGSQQGIINIMQFASNNYGLPKDKKPFELVSFKEKIQNYLIEKQQVANAVQQLIPYELSSALFAGSIFAKALGGIINRKTNTIEDIFEVKEEIPKDLLAIALIELETVTNYTSAIKFTDQLLNLSLKESQSNPKEKLLKEILFNCWKMANSEIENSLDSKIESEKTYSPQFHI